MVVGVHGLVGQPRDQPAAPQQAVLRQRGAQRLALRALADDDGLPPRRGLQQRRQVQRALVGVQPAHKGENFGLRVQPQRTAQLRAIRLQEEYRFIGEWTLSVSVMTLAFRLLANSSAFKVRIEYRGKLIPMMTSSAPIRMSCSKISLELFVVTGVTLSQTRFR